MNFAMFRRFLIFLTVFFISTFAFAAFPKPAGFVNDFAGVIDAGAKPRLESLLSSFAKTSGIEIAVVTLPSLDGRAVDDVAVDLYKTWGIGKKGKDNGALFLVAPNEKRMRIEAGYGLEGVLNDALAGRIMDENVIPNFKAGDISAGIAAGTVAIVKTISAKEGIDFDADAALGKSFVYDSKPVKKSSPISIAFKVLFFIFMAYLLIRHPWLFLMFISSGGGRSGGGGFSGGFGGFGGGISGGGGASRSW